MSENNKRQYRELDDETKQKISNALKGKPKSYSHAQHISQAMTDYWKKIPSKNNEVESLNPNDEM